MKRTALFASIALAAGLAAPAMAQEIGGVTVSAEDWVYVEDYCETLEDCAEAGLIDVPVPGETADDEMDNGDAGEEDAE